MSTVARQPSAYDERQWWKSAIVYQVWPHSFCDSNGDGIGDLQGIRSKLDHIKDLGCNVVWLSPIYASPLKDFGYDISDYSAINPLYGNMQDFDELVTDVHAKGMKIMLDLVVNHTSASHEWFKESRSSKDNPKRGWYHWQPAKKGPNGERLPPNNWASSFSTNVSAWQWDEHTQEYFLMVYNGEQPDLQWDNKEVRFAVYDMMNKWFTDHKVDGFRKDVICMLSKVPGYPDAAIHDPAHTYQHATEMYVDGPRSHEYIQEMNREVLSKYDQINVGEFYGLFDADRLALYVQPERKELQMLFLFEAIEVDGAFNVYEPMKLSNLKKIMRKWQVVIPERMAWNSIYIQNHDHSRCISRFTDDSPQFREVAAKMLAIYEITLSGTLYIYQGEEIGMVNMPKSVPFEEYQDVAIIDHYKGEQAKRQKKTGQSDPDMSDVLDYAHRKGRDHARTPVQWDDSANGGFTTGKPWMRLNNPKEINVASQKDDPKSVLSFWKQAIAFKKSNAACTFGHYVDLDHNDEAVYIYSKEAPEQKLLVVLNWSNKPSKYRLKDDKMTGTLALSNYADAPKSLSTDLDLRPYEALVFELH